MIFLKRRNNPEENDTLQKEAKLFKLAVAILSETWRPEDSDTVFFKVTIM